MNGYLLDTNILSELSRQRPSEAVRHWLEGIDEDRMFLSVLTLGEILYGIEKISGSCARIGTRVHEIAGEALYMAADSQEARDRYNEARRKILERESTFDKLEAEYRDLQNRSVHFGEWYPQLVMRFNGRTLAVDHDVVKAWSTLRVRAGRPLPTVDSLIAATAIAHDLAVVTRNIADFTGLVNQVVNPWEVVS